MIRAIRVAACIVALAAPAVSRADEPTFAELLAKAHAQVAAGHKWAPVGDNVSETFSDMIDRLHTATPEQVAEFEAMLGKAQEEAETGTNRLMREQDAARQPRANAGPAVSPQPDDAAVPQPRQATDEAAAAQPRPAPDQATTSQSRPSSYETAAVQSKPITDEATTPRPNVVAAARPSVDQPAKVPPQTRSMTAMASPSVPEGPAMRGIQEQWPQPAAPAPAKPQPQVLAPYAEELFQRGRAAEKQGDISGARRYYAAAAQGGHAAAAQAAGRLYDPVVLKGKVVGGIDADAATARHWYDRAAQLGFPSASNSTVSVK